MSELKVFQLTVGKNLETDSPLVVGVDNKWNSRAMSGEEVYLKSEADKVIVYQKYKRCLAMAYVEWLKQMIIGNHPESILYRRAFRREHKWKEMAQKFKEAK